MLATDDPHKNSEICGGILVRTAQIVAPFNDWVRDSPVNQNVFISQGSEFEKFLIMVSN